MSSLKEILAGSYSHCIINASRRGERVSVEAAITDTPREDLFHELSLDLPGYMRSVRRGDIFQVCYDEAVGANAFTDERVTLYGLLMASYADVVLADIKRRYRFTFCRGCNYVDSCGMKGHPSQTKHECLMTSDAEQLDLCFVVAFMMMKRANVIKAFLARLELNQNILRPVGDSSFRELIRIEMIPLMRTVALNLNVRD